MNKKIVGLSASITLLALPVVALALDIKVIIQNTLDLVVWPVFIGAVIIMFIWAGFLFVVAAGDPSKITTARKAVLWAIIGAAVGIAAFSAVGIIKKVLGV